MAIYLGGALLLAVVAAGGWAIRGELVANQAGGDAQPSPTRSGSDYQRADYFLNSQLGPSVEAATQTLAALKANCTASLPLSCRDAIIATDQALRKTLTVIDNADIPPCIAAPTAQLKKDWAAMELGLQIALGGYQDYDNEMVGEGLIKFDIAARPLQADAAALDKAAQTCTR
jgi:hypothetical protein